MKNLLLVFIFCLPLFSGFAKIQTSNLVPTTFVISNETPGYLIDYLVTQGYGDSCIYSVMQYLQPLSGGAIPQWFMDSLAACPAGSEIFTAPFSTFTIETNNPVGVNSDGTLLVVDITGRDYYTKEGYETFSDELAESGKILFTSATTSLYYINTGASTTLYSGGAIYYAFAIVWSVGLVPTVSTGEILDLKTDSVLVLGEVTDAGGLAVTQRGIVYSTSEGTTLESGTVIADTSSGAGEFSVNIPGLTPNTTYYVRAYAVNSQGTSYGETRSFTTPISLKNIAVGSLPQNLAVDRKTNKVYVANNIGNTVTVINGRTGLTDTTIVVGSAPYFVGVNDSTNKIYIPNNYSNTVSVINGATNSVEATIAVGSGPRAAVVNEKTNKVYVPADYSSNPGKVYVIDARTNSVEDTVTVGWRPIAAAVNEKTNKIYVANNNSKSVTVIDGATGNAETIAVGNSPRYIAINDSTSHVYVVNYRDSSITVVNGSTNETDTIHLAKNAYSWAAAVNRVTNKIYVSNSGTNTVTVIDGATNDIRNINVGKAPEAIAVNEATNRVYVGNYKYDDRSSAGYIVTEIDGETDEIVGFACVNNPAELTVNCKDNKTYIINGNKVQSIAETAPVVAISPDTLEIAGNGGSASFTISSNITWRLLPGQSWLTLSSTTGKGNNTITVTATANTTATERNATITLCLGYDADTLTVHVIQKKEITLAVSPSSLTVAATEGSTANFFVTSNTSWTVSSDQSWLTISPTSETGNNTVAVTALSNTTTNTRMASVTILATGVSSQTITITQAAGAATLWVSDNRLSLTGNGDGGNETTFTITSNINWAVATDQSWLTVIPTSGTGDGIVIIIAETNPNITERLALITVSGESVTSQTVTITQAAGEATLSVSPSTINIAADGGGAVISIVSNTSWIVSSDQTWLTVSPASGTGGGVATLTAVKNSTASERSANVTISGDGVASQTITVTQPTKVGVIEQPIAGILVYPNPFTDGFYVEINDQAVKVSVFDMSGRLVLSKETSVSGYISAGNLSKGFYIVKLETEDKEIQKKLVRR